MSVSERLVGAVTPIVPVCVSGVYTGEAPVYCTYNLRMQADSYGDDAPEAFTGSGMLHLFTPRTTDPRSICHQLWQALEAAELWPEAVEDASDEDGNHMVIEFSALEGV